MFRLESYITSIITGYIDKYISNFKREDAQLSLWEGDALFKNLDLDLDAVNQELNLPFSLVSGHIHALHIHVPYTKITSEPVVVTINTIECVLKLKPPGQEHAQKKRRTSRAASSPDEPTTTATGGVNRGLLFKVVSNLHVTCNNLILKYVEDDIVLSMNIREVEAVTVDKYWNPMYSVLSAVNAIMRKLITLTDITICLDKRNASGRIEAYLEPILYKCSLKIRISRTFSSNSSLSKTRIAFYSDNVTLSISQPQVPMLLRLLLLARVTLAASRSGSHLLSHSSEVLLQTDDEEGEDYIGWGTWMWSMLPSFSLSSSSVSGQTSLPQSVDVAAYIDEFILNFKLIEEGKTWLSLMQAKFEGCFAELTTNTTDWTNLLCGISHISLTPQPTTHREVYLECGHHVEDYKKNSLFENPDVNLVQRTWELHISAITEKVLNERAPALALDFMSSVEFQPENWIDNYPSEGLEKTLTRAVVGVLEVNVCSGLVDRVVQLFESLKNYDYPPYLITPVVSSEEISVQLKESNSRVLEGLIPLATYQFTLIEALVKVFAATSKMSPSKLRLYNDVCRLQLNKKQPYLYLRVKSLDGSYLRPMYPDVLLHLKALLTPSPELVAASKANASISALSINVGVKLDGQELPDMFEVYKFNCSGVFSHIFESPADLISLDSSLQIERATLASTKARTMLAYCLAETFFATATQSTFLCSSSLLQDALISIGFPYFEMNLRKMYGRYARSGTSESLVMKLGSLDGKTYQSHESRRNYVIVLSADPPQLTGSPESGGGPPGTAEVLEVVAQRPLTEAATVPLLLYFKLRQFHLTLDSTVFKWLLYLPQALPQGSTLHSFTSLGSGLSRKISNSSLSSLSKKLPDIDEVKEKAVETAGSTPPASSSTTLPFTFEDFNWLMQWLSLALHGELTDLQFSYRGEDSCSLHLALPSALLSSAQGRFSIDSHSLPVPYGVLKKNSISFPLRLEMTGMRGWSSCSNGSREPLLDEFHTTCTVALTSSVLPSPLLAFTLHIDTSHISLALRRVQMASLMEFWNNVLKVLNLVSFYYGNKTEEMEQIQTRRSGGRPASISEDSASNQSATTPLVKQKEGDVDGVGSTVKQGFKFTWWLQWTLTKLTISLFTVPPQPGQSEPELQQKLSFDLEDIIASLEVDPVYQKLKMKIGSSTIKHYTKDVSGGWKTGSYGGCIMCAQESNSSKSEFLSLTLTRASAASLHSRLATLMKISHKELRGDKAVDRYVMEMVLSVEPLDFILSPLVLLGFSSILEPLLLGAGAGGGGGGTSLGHSPPPSSPPLTHLTTARLPLVYFDLLQVRLFIISSTTLSNSLPDAFLIQIDEIALRSEAVNPVSRKLLRSDVTKVTSVPGSRFEDRQYQLDFSIQVMSGRWSELESQVCCLERVPDREENPAVAWNTVGGAPRGAGRAAHLSCLLSKLATTLIFAPPILSSGILISGLYFEGNLISEAEVKLSTDDLQLGLSLLREVNSVLPESPEPSRDAALSADLESGIGSTVGSNSSVLTKDLREQQHKSSRITVSHISIATSTSINTRGSRERRQVVPSDILLTAKGLTFKLFSKEVTEEEGGGRRRPLLYVCIAQPYVSYEKQGDTTIYKASVFDLTIRHGDEGDSCSSGSSSSLPPSDFGFSLLESREGEPDPYKGIPPALVNLKSTSQGSKPPAVRVEVGRPLKVVVKASSLRFLRSLPELLRQPSPSSHPPPSTRLSQPRSLYSMSEPNVRSVKSNVISALTLSTKQFVIEFVSCEPVDIGPPGGLLLSVNEVDGGLTLGGSQISGHTSVRGMVLSLGSHFILTPWSFSANALLIRESWTPHYIFRFSLSSDVLALDFIPSQITKLKNVINEIKQLLTQETDLNAPNEDSPPREEEDEETYLDDLQTGAFQFSKGNDLPAAYQVTFPSSGVMAWAYPYPRTVTSLSLQPVPFIIACPEGVELWLECLAPLEGWVRMGRGRLTEGQPSRMELLGRPRAAVLWRIIIDTNQLPIDVKTLGASVRVDSLFSRRLIPQLEVSCALDKLSVCLFAEVAQSASPLAQPLSRYTLAAAASPLQRRYPFATFALLPLSLHLQTRKTNEKELKVDCRPRLDIVNARSMKEMTVLHPFSLRAEIYSSSESQVTFRVVGDSLTSFIAPSLAHSLQSALTSSHIQPFIVCNDTTYFLSFGQVESGEDIPLYRLQSYFYSWKNSNLKMQLRFSINTSSVKAWSSGVSLTKEGTQAVDVTDDGGRILTALITIKKLSSVLIQITFAGELMLQNRLDQGLDVRIVPNLLTERQRIIRLEGEERCPSILLVKDCQYSLRLALSSGWSGPIPLAEPTAWLVKVPHKGEGNYLSLWCQVLIEKYTGFKRLLVLLSPMYQIKSLLGGDATVCVRTAELKSELEAEVRGRGAITNLYTPGTTHHRHSFTFNILGKQIPRSERPHLSVSYSEVAECRPPEELQQQQEGGGTEAGGGASSSSERLTSSDQQEEELTWPYLGPPWDQLHWQDTSQPSTLTRVKVRFSREKLTVPHTIELELEPWCLLANTLGSTLALAAGEDILCRLPHLSVVAPPCIESTFHLLVKFPSGDYHQSSGFQLSDNQSFYKPHIPQLIPQVAIVHFKVQSPNSVFYGVLNSKMHKNMRLLHISSSFMIANLTSVDLRVCGFSLPAGGDRGRNTFPPDLSSSTFLAKKTSRELAEPLTEWAGGGEDSGDRQLYLVFGSADCVDSCVGNPIKVPLTPGAREVTTLLLPSSLEEGFYNTPLSVVFQEKEGITYITVDEDPSPQLLIHNHTGYDLLVGTSSTPQGGDALEEIPDWDWRLGLPRERCGYYRMFTGPGQPLSPLVIARATVSTHHHLNSYDWSSAISLTAAGGGGPRLIGLPGAHDLVATVSRVGFTSHLYLSVASQCLISAADVRSRLSLLSQDGGSGAQSTGGGVDAAVPEPLPQDLPLLTCRQKCLKPYSRLLSVEGVVALRGVNLTICSDAEESFDCQEVLSLSLEHVVASFQPNKAGGFGKSELCLTVWEVQVDNQKYQKGGYDFSVILTGGGGGSRAGAEEEGVEGRCRGEEDLAGDLLAPRPGCPALELSFRLDVTHSLVLEEVEASARPFELYLEDTYLTEVQSHLSDLLRTGLEVRRGGGPRRQASPEEAAEVEQRRQGKKSEQELQVTPDRTTQSSTPPQSPLLVSRHPHSQIPLSDEDDVWSEDEGDRSSVSRSLPLPSELLASSYELSRPLRLSKLYISPIQLKVSLHTSTKFYIALDQSPLSFSEFTRQNVVTSPYRLGHALTVHYFLGAIYGTGWALGSLQLLGAPAGLARSLGQGLTSLVSLPYEGLARGPTGFLVGVFHGSASLMKHLTAGTLSCVTKLAGSWSRTLDRLTLSPEDLRFAEEMRRLRPHGLADGLRQGLTEFGVSLLGGVGGLAQRPLEYALGDGGSLVGSVGRGLVGAMARPLSGAASLLAVTTQGILAGAGWTHVLKPKATVSGVGSETGGRACRLSYSSRRPLLVLEGSSSGLEPTDLILSLDGHLSLVTTSSRSVTTSEELYHLSEVIALPDQSDPTLVLIYRQSQADMMLKLSEKRTAEYVRESQRALQQTGARGGGVSVEPSLGVSPHPADHFTSSAGEPVRLYLSPAERDYFLAYLEVLARHATNRGFPVLL